MSGAHVQRELASNPSLGVEDVRAWAYTIPTDSPESDGTLEWDSTTLVVVEINGRGQRGTGYTYASASTAACVLDTFASVIERRSFHSPLEAWDAMVQRTRNLGHCGIAAMAISAIDIALWDLWGREIGVSTAMLLGAVRDRVPAYGSGGFTSYSVGKLQKQVAGWVKAGMSSVKMKVGRDPSMDAARVRAAREAIGWHAGLYVDANGAYEAKQAITLAERFADESRVSWLEEPRPADDITGTCFVRDHVPHGVEVAGGEYIYRVADANRLLDARVVDVLQADVTRCGGFTGFMRIAAAAEAHGVSMSTHCAPTLSAHAAVAAKCVRHIEYFHDHARIESRFVEGACVPRDGLMAPDLSRPGIGIEFKHEDLRAFASGTEACPCG